MHKVSVSGVRLAGVVACLPEQLLDNRVACEELFGDSVETLIKATGIEKRAIAAPGTTALDLNVAAARALLDATGTAPDEIGAVVCVTFTPEYLMPSDAPSAQHRLGLPTDVMAFDVSIACSGYGYGLYLGATLARATNKKVLVLDGDVQSAYVSNTDKATVPVMADVGTASLIVGDDSAEPWDFAFYTDGSQREALFVPAGGTRRPTRPEDLEPITYEDGSSRRDVDIFMDGFAIFRFVALTASKFIKEFMTVEAIEPDSLDAFVPHQANIYMIGQLAKKLRIADAMTWKSGHLFGNPASASIPLTIAHHQSTHAAEAGRTLIAGFGGGLSISVGVLRLPGDSVYQVIEYGEVADHG